jgi:hypothetical protein
MGAKRRRQAAYSKAANSLQDAQARSVDNLAEYETFREMFLPEIRKALMDGLKAPQILEKFKPIMAARLIQIGGTGGENAAITAIKEIMDRTEGKAVQKQEHTHRLARLPEEELDAVLASKLQRLTVDVTPRKEEDDSED